MAAQGSFYIEKAYERLTEISADDLKRLEYEAREKAIRDHNYLMDYNLKRGREEGQKKGMELGIKQGIEQGIEQGAKALIEMCLEDSRSREETSSRLIRRLCLSPETAEEYLKKYWMV